MMTNNFPPDLPPAGRKPGDARRTGASPDDFAIDDAALRDASDIDRTDIDEIDTEFVGGTGVPGTTGAGTGIPGTTGTTGTGDMGGKASHLKEEASEAGHHVAHVAKDETKRVASETGAQAKHLLRNVGDELRGQAATQQTRVAEGLRAVSSELSGMADSTESPGMATGLVHQVADRANSVAEWLDAREPGSLLEEVKSFARQRPGVFIALAAGAGVLAGRLTRALVEPSEASDASRQRTQAPPVSPVPPARSAASADLPIGGTRPGDLVDPGVGSPGVPPMGGLS